MAVTTLHRQSSDAFLELDRSMKLENRATQLASLLRHLYGDSSDSFNALRETDRDNILWLAGDLASEIDELVSGVRNE